MKKKTYCYENRTFEVEVYNELGGYMLSVYVDEIIRPNRNSLVVLNLSIMTTLSLITIPLLMKLLNQLSRRACR